MKKTLSMIYRFIFILFSVWGICSKIGFNILTFTPRILNFTLFVDFLSFICVFIVFIIRITHKPPRGIEMVKAALTLCSILVFIKNLPVLKSTVTYDWVLGILLPVMMVLDWLLFDDKGRMKLYDPILWLAAAIVLFAAAAFMLKKLFGIEDFWNVLGMFADNDGLKRLLAEAAAAGAALYILDRLGSAFNNKNFNSAFALIYRLAFLALEIYAFLMTVGKDLTKFISSLMYYHLLTNFLCAVCIAVTVIYSLVKYGTSKKGTPPFPSLKAGFTMSLLICMAARLIFNRQITGMSIAEMIFYFIAPLMMLFDWILFDKKGLLRMFDPLLWILIPLLYFVAAVMYFIPYCGLYYELFTLPQPEMLAGSAAVIITAGYVYYMADRLSDR